jgi:hypothetical protein
MAANADYAKEFKKLDFMLQDLRSMQAELLPNDNKGDENTAGMDKFTKAKSAVNKKLKEVREGVQRLEDAKRNTKGERDAEVIKIMTGNTRIIKEATALWSELKQTLIKEEKSSKGKKMDRKLIEDRNKMVKTLGQEIVDLTNRNSRIPGGEGPAGQTEPDLEDGQGIGGGRGDKKSKKREERRAKRKEKTKKAGAGGGGGGGGSEMDDLADAAPMSQQEQAFMEARDTAFAEQDQMLDEISKGLDELLELGEDMNKNLKMQQEMLDEVGDKIDRNIAALQTANSRLKNLLEQSGGLSRWLPMMICIVFLLALVGYLYSRIDKLGI